MSANKRVTAWRSDEGLIGETDLASVDAHEIQPHEYDELPELTDEALATAVIRRRGVLVGPATGRIAPAE